MNIFSTAKYTLKYFIEWYSRNKPIIFHINHNIFIALLKIQDFTIFWYVIFLAFNFNVWKTSSIFNDFRRTLKIITIIIHWRMFFYSPLPTPKFCLDKKKNQTVCTPVMECYAWDKQEKKIAIYIPFFRRYIVPSVLKEKKKIEAFGKGEEMIIEKKKKRKYQKQGV